MKLAQIGAILGLVAVDHRNVAELEQDLPACSRSCFNQAALTYGCQPWDLTCRCDKEVQMAATMQRCLERSCSQDDHKYTSSLSHHICDLQLQRNYFHQRDTSDATAGAATVTVTVTAPCSGGTTTAPTAVGSFATTSTIQASSIPASVASVATTPSAAATTVVSAAATTVVTAGAAALATPAVLLAGVAAMGALLL